MLAPNTLFETYIRMDGNYELPLYLAE